MILTAIRSLIFYALYLGQTAVLALVAGTVAAIARGRTRLTWEVAKYWGRSNLFLLRWVVGIRTQVEGAENIPDGPCIIAAKHQSDWDIFAILPHTNDRPAFIAKRQLLDIPFFGWAARSFDTIRVDRERGGEAIPLMLTDGAAAVGKGCKIVIFPEGTRTAPMADPNYRFGVARLYEALNIPVVPVALNSGFVWGRNSLLLWPGTATARFLPAIEPGLAPEAFHRQLQAVIETESAQLAIKAFRDGIAAPLAAETRSRIAALAGEISPNH